VEARAQRSGAERLKKDQRSGARSVEERPFRAVKKMLKKPLPCAAGSRAASAERANNNFGLRLSGMSDLRLEEPPEQVHP